MTTTKTPNLLQEYFENAAILANLKAAYFNFRTLDDQVAEIERQMRSVRKMQKMSRNSTKLNSGRSTRFATSR